MIIQPDFKNCVSSILEKVSFCIYTLFNSIYLLPSLEGDMKICPTQKIHVARGQIFMSPD